MSVKFAVTKGEGVVRWRAIDKSPMIPVIEPNVFLLRSEIETPCLPNALEEIWRALS